jgi:GDPmannose 4,6-dehydratase
VRTFIELAFKVIGITLAWTGEGVDEVGFDKANPERQLVKIDPKYFRPTEVELLIGDPSKAKEKLGWVPETKMEDLCKEMVLADIALVEKGDFTS